MRGLVLPRHYNRTTTPRPETFINMRLLRQTDKHTYRHTYTRRPTFRHTQTGKDRRSKTQTVVHLEALAHRHISRHSYDTSTNSPTITHTHTDISFPSRGMHVSTGKRKKREVHSGARDSITPPHTRQVEHRFFHSG